MTDRLIRITTALAVVAVAVVAAVISYQHAFELVRSHGESGVTARLLPFTVDGLIWAASMMVLDASRRGQPVPRLAAWRACPLPASACLKCTGATRQAPSDHPVSSLLASYQQICHVPRAVAAAHLCPCSGGVRRSMRNREPLTAFRAVAPSGTSGTGGSGEPIELPGDSAGACRTGRAV